MHLKRTVLSNAGFPFFRSVQMHLKSTVLSVDACLLFSRSAQVHPTTVNFSMEAGVHTLTWVFSKDSKSSAGQDTASILVSMSTV